MINIQKHIKEINKEFSQHEKQFNIQMEKVNSINDINDLYNLNGANIVKDRISNNLLSQQRLLEQIIGDYNLLDLNYLKKGLMISQTVCRISYDDGIKFQGIGSGFLVGPGLLMTNNHVISNIQNSLKCLAEFNYERDINNKVEKVFRFKLRPDIFFITNNELDYTVIGVESVAFNDSNKTLIEYGWNKLKDTKKNILVGEAVSIIQHPLGKPKMIAIRSNKIVEKTNKELYYSADTQPGSSGSLVANDQWEIVALHKASLPMLDNHARALKINGSVQYKANIGVRMDLILDDIYNHSFSNPEQESLKSELLKYYNLQSSKGLYVLP